MNELDVSRVLFKGWLSIWDTCYQVPLAVLASKELGKRPTLVP